jgi:hypothetical protein
MNGKNAFIATSVVLLSACTGPINEQTVSDMPTGYLCDVNDGISKRPKAS